MYSSSAFCFSESSGDDQSDQIAKLGLQNRQLQSTVENLSAQLSALREQHSTSSTIQANIESIFSERKKANKKITILCNERDDLKDRLGMCARSNADLQCKIHFLEEESRQITQLIHTVKDLKMENENLKSQNDKLKRANSKNSEQTRQVLNLASNHFQRRFDQPGCLISFFNEKAQRDVNCVITVDQQVEKLMKIIQNLKRKNKKLDKDLLETKEQLVKERAEGIKSQRIPDINYFESSDADLKFEKQEMALKKLQEEMNTQNYTISELKNERDRLVRILQKQNEMMRNFEYSLRQTDRVKSIKKRQ